MTKRERELAERHAATLENMRDARWQRLYSKNADTATVLQAYHALDYAAKLLRAELAKPEGSVVIAPAA